MQIVDNGTPTQIKEVFAESSITRPPSLPPSNMGKSMLHCHSFTKLSASLRGLLTLAQLDEQGFIGVNTDATPFRAGRALGFQRTLGADVFWKMNNSTGHKGHFLLRWTANDLPFPSPV